MSEQNVNRSSVIAEQLRMKRCETAEVFASALELTPKWKALADNSRDARDNFLETEFFAFVDYLAEYFERGDDTFKQLLIGEKIKAFYDPTISPADRLSQIQAVHTAEYQGFEKLFSGALGAMEWQRLAQALTGIHELLATETSKKQRVLLIGDCLFLDIVPFIVGPLLQAGITLHTDYATSKNPIELRDQLRKLADEKFDLVFFSPFSYDFSPEYSQVTNWRNAMMSEKKIAHIVEKVWGETQTTLDLMADLFDCPIHVHNSANIIREDNKQKRRVKMLASSSAREKARALANARLEDYVNRKNAEAFKHLFIVDEHAIISKFGELEAGAYFYHTAIQHPAVFGKVLAEHYVDVIYVNALLVKKKLVICDLDNTLWEGVIGEGAVSHYHDRQQVLKDLKVKGVVLAINSKNDPANVHWTGGTLSDDDFVYADINWEPKVNGMKRIQNELNLKMKDFVFVDDREDEREMTNMLYPEILCVDATDAKVWARFRMWRDALEDDLEMDRTLMYKQREQRKAFVKEESGSEEEKAALFKSLELKLTITHAQPSDLKRVAELINRTNQFNLEGSRTSFKEVSEWHASPDYLILTGQTSDRFGDMGTT
ncbi:MAG TPA: HAD-IIIC family phosphatase, partial [Pseudomonadales bacterium]|nr:HAD-IIIC family phosphatase [Pseudomonadales bacterium]